MWEVKVFSVSESNQYLRAHPDEGWVPFAGHVTEIVEPGVVAGTAIKKMSAFVFLHRWVSTDEEGSV